MSTVRAVPRRYGRRTLSTGMSRVAAAVLALSGAGCSVFGESDIFSVLPSACFTGFEPAISSAVGALASADRRDAVPAGDASLPGPSLTTKICTLAFTDRVGRTDWRQGDPYFRQLFVQYDLYHGAFFTSGVSEAKAQLKPSLVDSKKLTPESAIGNEAVGWWDDSSNQGASWTISLRLSNMRVLVRLAGADYRSDYTEVRRFSPERDNSSPGLKAELQKGAQTIAKAVVDRLAHPAPAVPS